MSLVLFQNNLFIYALPDSGHASWFLVFLVFFSYSY